MSADRIPENRPARDMARYERLISQGIAEADRCGGAVDHVTARRMALVLLSRSQDPDFMRGLIRFARDGAMLADLRARAITATGKRSRKAQPDPAVREPFAIARHDPDTGTVILILDD